MTYHRLCAVLLGLCGATTLAHAQVLRCEDARGHVTYTNTECPHSQRSKEIAPRLSDEEKAQQEAQYQQALERKREEQIRWAELDAARRKADAERATAEAARRPPAPPIIVQVPASDSQPPSYGLLNSPRHTPKPNPKAPGYNCNVFKCYDGKGNVWMRP